MEEDLKIEDAFPYKAFGKEIKSVADEELRMKCCASWLYLLEGEKIIRNVERIGLPEIPIQKGEEYLVRKAIHYIYKYKDHPMNIVQDVARNTNENNYPENLEELQEEHRMENLGILKFVWKMFGVFVLAHVLMRGFGWWILTLSSIAVDIFCRFAECSS